jgi:lipopolysaccharide/colanic/teichoic acid biosynthesis glycosyltransferase
MKRVVDIVVSIILLILLMPLSILVAIIIKLDSRGPVFYLAQRTGKNGHSFSMYKFRTMILNADINRLPLTSKDDIRVTRAGSALRATRLDELPQLFNVLKGDMSFVGPRPEDPYYVERYSSDQRKVLSIRPGITGPSQLRFRDEESLLDVEDPEHTYLEEIMPQKLSLDMDYVESHTLSGDMALLLKTLMLPFTR